ncbi:GTPase [Marivita hallyeonensis]|uniref:50S ribosome-binding GTPase n=1 Tax=Marivita hallyeonensis TaxID=996342 RepID=A0A1M5LQM8_9RHOB|nr:GTPase [Marivita hallyeonensis]SHG67452.1 50S ribosome-binding GTPase [Marivita hallyeonensis]
MSAEGIAQESQRNLIEALESGQLSDALVAQGQDILARMQSVLRLSVLGLPGSGKSTLLNLLLGSRVIPEGVRLPTLKMQYGEAPSAKCTLADGSVETLNHADFDAISHFQPAFVDVSMPLPALSKLSLMEVVAGDDPTEQQRAVAWAAKRSDIALWCTTNPTPLDQQLWALLPDRLLDHSFLMVTKAETASHASRIDHARKIGEELFFQALPIDAVAAVDARKPDGTVDKEALRASGGMALISAILREVENGQRAASDAADVFLRQVDFDPTRVAQRHIERVEPVSTATTNEAVATPIEAPTPVATHSSSSNVPDPQTSMGPAARAACAQVVDQLVAEGAALADRLASNQITDNDVVEVSVDTVTWIAEYLAEAAVANDTAMQRTCELANGAADLVQLIQLEKGDDVALDALSLMIQLKQELQAELAA